MFNVNRNSFGNGPKLGEFIAPEANNFSVIRLAMAALVLISHSYLYTFGTSEAEPLTAWTGHSLGEHAVQVFFILSGILVAQSFDRSRSLLDFAVARVLRIFPALIVCVTFTALFLGPLLSLCPISDYFSSWAALAYVVKTLSLSTGSAPLPGVFNNLPLTGNINTSLWTLKYEAICYVLLALAGLCGLFKERWRSACSAALAVFLVAVYAVQPKAAEAFNFIDNLRYFLQYFGTGVFAYLVRDRLVIAAPAVIALAIGCWAAAGTRMSEFAMACFLCYTMLWAARLELGRIRQACNRIDMSFGVYIFAAPIQQALLDVVPGLHPLGVALLAAVVVFPLALLSWVFVERPALHARARAVRLLTGLVPGRDLWLSRA